MQIKQLVSDMRQALRLFGVNQWRCFEHGQTKIVVAWSWKAVLVCVRGSWKPGNFRADADVRASCCSTSVLALAALFCRLANWVLKMFARDRQTACTACNE